MLEIGLVGGTRSQEDNPGFLAPGRVGGEVRKGGAEVAEEPVEPLRPRPVKLPGEGGAHDQPVLERVTEPGGGVQPVLEHPPSCRPARARCRRRSGAGRRPAGSQPRAGPQEVRVGHRERRGDDAVAQEFLRAVEVGQQGVVQVRALAKPVAQQLPVPGAQGSGTTSRGQGFGSERAPA